MTSEPCDPLAAHLVYEECLPLAWRPLEAMPDEVELARYDEGNEALLKVLAAPDDHHRVRAEADERVLDIQQELVRLDLKLNLLMELVGRSLSRETELPPQAEVRISAEGIQWSSPTRPAPGSHVLIELYVEPRFARPLELPGVVVAAEDNPPSAKVAFHGLSESTTDWLEKLIFKHHRRQIAIKRARRRS